MNRTGALLTVIWTLALAAPAARTAAPTPDAEGLPSAYVGGQIRIAYFGGRVIHSPRVHLLVWGQWDPTLVSAEVALFRQLAGTAYNGILGQYGVSNDVQLVGIRYVNEPFAMGNAIKWLRHHCAHISVRDVWVILLPPGAGAGDGCGEHLWLTSRYVVALVPDYEANGWANCVIDYSTDDGRVQPSIVAAETSIASHEYAEAVTDPEHDGWTTAPVFGEEIADPCYFYSGVPAGLTETVSYLWSKALHTWKNGCEI